MDIWQTIDGILKGIFGGFCLFVACCMWVLCEEDVKEWWRRRKNKGQR